MDETKRTAVILKLIDSLWEKREWCGETHIQKAVYLLQELFGVPLGFGFIMYKFAPFSFELRDELTLLRANELLTLRVSRQYGAGFGTTEWGQDLLGRFPETVNAHVQKIDTLTDKLAGRNITDLEQLTTSLYINRKKAGTSKYEQACELIRLKPHIPMEVAQEAVDEFDQLQKEMQAV